MTGESSKALQTLPRGLYNQPRPQPSSSWKSQQSDIVLSGRVPHLQLSLTLSVPADQCPTASCIGSASAISLDQVPARLRTRDSAMALTRGSGSSIFDPFFGNSIFDPFENFPLFDRMPLPTFPRDVSSVANTRVDWVETPEAHVFKADLPGLKKEEVKVQVTEDKYLSISGERSKEEVNEKDSYRHVERSYGKFYRQFKLPENAKAQEVGAKMENGVLTVTVPKAEVTKEKSKVRDVQITN